jgi:hypothetical protein
MSNWILKRNDNDAAVTLPEDLQWTDEHDWSAIAQTSPVYSLSGSVLVQQGTKLAGRPITLAGDWVWVPKVTVDTLRTWSDVPALKMTLTHYDGRQFTVCFRTHEKALSVEPVQYATPEDGTDRYTVTINLMTL